MVPVQKIREYVMTLPGVEEGPPVRAARRSAAFKVAGKSFLGIETGETTMTVSLGEEARALATKHPEAYEEIWRQQKFLGLRVHLSKVTVGAVRELIEKSWRHCASKHIVNI